MSYVVVPIIPSTSLYVQLSSASRCLGEIGCRSVNDVAALLGSVVDCTGGSGDAHLFVGDSSKGRIIPWLTMTDDIDTDPNFVATDRTYIAGLKNVWAMNGNMPAGCEAMGTISYASSRVTRYLSDWASYNEAACGASKDDFWRVQEAYNAADRLSYLDFVHVVSGSETQRYSALRSYLWSTMQVPQCYARSNGMIGVETGHAGYRRHDPVVRRVHVQTSVTNDFTVLIVDRCVDLVTPQSDGKMSGSIDGFVGYDTTRDIYIRVRYENADGSIVSPWSVTLTMSAAWSNDYYYGTHTVHTIANYDCYSLSGISGATQVAEVNNDTVETTWNITGQPQVANGKTYVQLMRIDVAINPGNSVDASATFTPYVLYFDGTNVTLIQLASGVVDANAGDYSWINMQTRGSGLCLLDNKVYAWWAVYASSAPTSDRKVGYVREVTDGILGDTIEIDSDPATFTADCYLYDVCVCNLYGKLTLAATVDTGSAYYLCLADILATDPSLKMTDIAADYLQPDVWNNALWLQVDSYDGNSCAISWLGQETQTHSFPWLGRFQLAHVL